MLAQRLGLYGLVNGTSLRLERIILLSHPLLLVLVVVLPLPLLLLSVSRPSG